MIEVFPDPEALASGAASRFAALAAAAVAQRGRFTVLLAGGETPQRTYERLASEPWRSSLPWPQVEFFWGDERCVAPDDPRSNAAMVRRALLDHLPLRAQQIHPICCGVDPQIAADAYAEALRRSFTERPPVFDLVLLGLGSDGHIASLLPDSAAVHEAVRWTAVTARPEEGFSRVTVTLPLLNQARTVLFLVAGRSKAAILEAVISGTVPDSPLPAQLIRPFSGELCWLVDAAAATELQGINRGAGFVLSRRRPDVP